MKRHLATALFLLALGAALRDMETKLLRAFYMFAEATQKRLADLAFIRERLTGFEARLTEVERRLNFPGAGSRQ